jgi:predicted MFS family arabinose efflux permease
MVPPKSNSRIAEVSAMDNIIDEGRREAGFWLLAVTVVTFFAASSAPSPLYVVYQAQWHFSELTLTLVFAVYVLALLAALLTVGGLSDFLGRRPVIVGALAVELVSMIAFATAGDTTLLFVARIVQGLATGAAAGALSAAVTDLAPRGRASLGAAVNTASPALGLAVGALASGALVQYAPAPRVLVYAVLAGLFAVLLAALTLVPETVARRPGALASLKPRAAVPPAARGAFLKAAPVLAATWAVGGLTLSLGPSLAVETFGLHSHFVGGLVVTAMAGTSAVVAGIARNWAARATMAVASIVLAAGIGVVLLSLALTSTPVFFVGLVVTGSGFGAAFVAAIGSVAPLATPAQRAELFAALFTVSYTSFGLSAVLMGLAVPHFGLRPVVVVVGFVVIALALSAAAAEGAARRIEQRARLIERSEAEAVLI